MVLQKYRLLKSRLTILLGLNHFLNLQVVKLKACFLHFRQQPEREFCFMGLVILKEEENRKKEIKR